MILKTTKSGEIKCPACGELKTPHHDYELDLMVLECCNRAWSLFPKEVGKVKRIKPRSDIEDRADLLRRLYNGKKERNAD